MTTAARRPSRTDPPRRAEDHLACSGAALVPALDSSPWPPRPLLAATSVEVEGQTRLYAADGRGLRISDPGPTLAWLLSPGQLRGSAAVRVAAHARREAHDLVAAGWIVDGAPVQGRVAVAGGGPFARAFVAALSATGHACPVFDPSSGHHWTELTSDAVDLVVITSTCSVADPALSSYMDALGLPHVMVSSLGGGAGLGPLVVPGHSPCRRCADLAMVDLDPSWPSALLKLAQAPAEPSERMVRWAAATLALEIAWWFGTGCSSLIGAVLSADPWHPGVRTRSVDAHADCCGRPQPTAHLKAVA